MLCHLGSFGPVTMDWLFPHDLEVAGFYDHHMGMGKGTGLS